MKSSQNHRFSVDVHHLTTPERILEIFKCFPASFAPGTADPEKYKIENQYEKYVFMDSEIGKVKLSYKQLLMAFEFRSNWLCQCMMERIIQRSVDDEEN